jgi:TPR repeat protein
MVSACCHVVPALIARQEVIIQMFSWLHETRKKRSGERIIANRMRLVATQAVPDWLCEFATLVESGVRPEHVSYEERSDAKRAEEKDIATFCELYPYRETPWACFLTLRYLTARPGIEDRLLDISDILAAVPSLRKGAPGYENVVARLRPRMTRHIVSNEVLKAVEEWLDGAEESVNRTAQISDKRLAFCYAVGQKFRARQAAMHSARKAKAAAEELVPHSAVRAAVECAPGDATPRDTEEAIEVLQQTAAEGDDRARFELLRRAAIDGNVRARYELGVACLAGNNGLGTQREGVMWIERAAAAGSARARLKLGRIYAEGKFVRRDPILALAWLKLAARSKQPGAKESSGHVAEQLSPWQVAAANWLKDHLQNGAARRLYASDRSHA